MTITEFIRAHHAEILDHWKVLLSAIGLTKESQFLAHRLTRKKSMRLRIDTLCERLYQTSIEDCDDITSAVSFHSRLDGAVFGAIVVAYRMAVSRTLETSGNSDAAMLTALDERIEQMLDRCWKPANTQPSDGDVLSGDQQSAINEESIQSGRLAVIGQLAAGVAHEIGNPLTSISSIVQLLKRRIDDPVINEQLTHVKTSVDRIAHIVHELVDFSRPAPFNPILTDINAVIQTAIGMMKYDRRVKNISFETEFAPDMPALFLVPDQILQVCINLLINAVDAMNGTGVISIRTWIDSDHVHASIRDTGRGIPKYLLPRIFDPFFTTKKVGEGTGLGLSVSYGIITKHRGKIDVHSIVGEGSTFTVSLPRTERTQR